MSRAFDRFASLASHYTGHPLSFLAAVLIVLVWAVSGPAFHYSDTWQLVINTGTTVVTFLMVFLVQATQNRDATALHAKLDGLIAAIEKADDRLIGLEKKGAAEIAAVVRPERP